MHEDYEKTQYIFIIIFGLITLFNLRRTSTHQIYNVLMISDTI